MNNTEQLLDRTYNVRAWLTHEVEHIKKTGHTIKSYKKADIIWMSRIAELIITSQKPYLDEWTYKNTVNECLSIIELCRQLIKLLDNNDKNLKWQLDDEEDLI